jgi:uncharacterized protein YecE (DUF72 family)
MNTYFLGCPQWKHLAWKGRVLPNETKPHDYLRAYSRVFNTVEGNTTFYGTPQIATLANWAEQTPPHFRFVFKVNKIITHEYLLQGKALSLTLEWINHFNILHDRMGPILIQLPARFNQYLIDELYYYLSHLPPHLQYAVELRHPIWTQEPYLSEVNQLLSACKVERVWMDTFALRQAKSPWTESTRQARQRKPNLTVYPIALGPCPIIRYVANPNLEDNYVRLDLWAQSVAEWMKQGRTPYFFAHYPGETYAPDIAEKFHERLRLYFPLPNRLPWITEQQFDLFKT